MEWGIELHGEWKSDNSFHRERDKEKWREYGVDKWVRLSLEGRKNFLVPRKQTAGKDIAWNWYTEGVDIAHCILAG